MMPGIGDPVLSVRAPWALLFFLPFGDKDIENRDWPTKVRGRFWVHVSATMKLSEYTEAEEFCKSIGRDCPDVATIQPFLGKIIGCAVIEGCVQRSPSPWFVGRYGFAVRGAQRIEPIRALGKLGWWQWQPADPRQGGAIPMRSREVYQGSDGALTKRYYAELESRGPLGQIAMNLFRAQKCSARAKLYRGRGYKSEAYARKSWSMGNLVEILGHAGAAEGISFGWKTDPATVFGNEPSWVLYVDLPDGQVSFHSPHRGAGPEYVGEFDGAHKSEERILEFCDRVFSGNPFRPNLTAATVPMEGARTEHVAAMGGIQEGLFGDALPESHHG